MKLGAYTLIRKIARGGIADIYLAKTTTALMQEKYLVCKCIRQNLTRDDEFLGSIINEAQFTTRLRHPNILEVFDLCACDGNAFLAMEYLDAQDLSRLIIHNNARNETLPCVYAAYVIGQVALGLHAAHEMVSAGGVPLRLVHRDVSPENILFSADGDIKIGDFGIAKTVFMPDVTPPDTIKGKFSYMSPEQAWADKIDRRSDIFSLAAVLYEATTGHCFYPSESIEACIQCARMALYDPPRNVCKNYPPKLEAILSKALDLDKKCRYATALEFKRALDDFILSQDQTVTRDDWTDYLRPRVSFPETILPRLRAGEFVPDASSLMAHAFNKKPHPESSDLITTGQIGADEIEFLRRKAIDMMSSDFSVLALNSDLHRPPDPSPPPNLAMQESSAQNPGSLCPVDEQAQTVRIMHPFPNPAPKGTTSQTGQNPFDEIHSQKDAATNGISQSDTPPEDGFSSRDTLPRIPPAVQQSEIKAPFVSSRSFDKPKRFIAAIVAIILLCAFFYFAFRCAF